MRLVFAALAALARIVGDKLKETRASTPHELAAMLNKED
jgi:hypothetical protein